MPGKPLTFVFCTCRGESLEKMVIPTQDSTAAFKPSHLLLPAQQLKVNTISNNGVGVHRHLHMQFLLHEDRWFE